MTLESAPRPSLREIALSLGISLGLGLGLATPLRSEDAPSGSVEPFAAHYTADWKSITVGTSDLELKRDVGPGQYLYTWTVSARGVFRIIYSHDVIQKSWLSIIDNHVRPERYHAEDGSSTADLEFDWTHGRAHGTSENKPVDLELRDGMQDVMSIQVTVMLALKNGSVPKSFRIVDKNEAKDFIYENAGLDRIRTELGYLDTVVVSSHRTASNRTLKMWFAPSLGYVPVQAERSHDGKLEFAMRIKSLTR